jgi:hypothetical protein
MATKTKPAAASKEAPAKASVKKASTVKVAAVKKSVSHEDIKKRAFEIHLSNGGNASAEQNWIQAEKELSK